MEHSDCELEPAMEDSCVGLILRLHEVGALKFGRFKDRNGLICPVFIDLRLIVSYPSLLEQVARLMWECISSHEHEVICGVPYTALAVATCISVAHKIPLVIRRKNEDAEDPIEGVFREGQRCLVIGDLVTSGDSMLEALHPLNDVKLKVTDVVVLIDREQWGSSNLEKHGVKLHSILTLTQIVETLLKYGKLSAQISDSLKQFLADNQATVTVAAAPLISQVDGQSNANYDVFTEKTSYVKVTVNHNIINVTLTKEGRVVQEWIKKQSSKCFGLDMEWKPNRRKGQKENKVALLQISSETDCLLVQMLFLDSIPSALMDFLEDPERKITGIGIHNDTNKLGRDYELICRGQVDLRTLAVVSLKDGQFKKSGLRSLAKHVLGFEMNKDKSVTLSNWSKSYLDRKQVEYACTDAWVALAIFCRLQNAVPGKLMAEFANPVKQSMADSEATVPVTATPLTSETPNPNYEVCNEKTSEVRVTLNNTIINVTLTKEGSVVQEWIEKQSAAKCFGLDLEWQPSGWTDEKESKVALLLISTITDCLLVQMLFLDSIPRALVDLLKDPERKIAGFGIHSHTQKLCRDYDLVCQGQVELENLKDGHSKGLKGLPKDVLGLDKGRSQSGASSDWSKSQLCREQVEHACQGAWAALALYSRLQDLVPGKLLAEGADSTKQSLADSEPTVPVDAAPLLSQIGGPNAKYDDSLSSRPRKRWLPKTMI